MQQPSQLTRHLSTVDRAIALMQRERQAIATLFTRDGMAVPTPHTPRGVIKTVLAQAPTQGFTLPELLAQATPLLTGPQRRIQRAVRRALRGLQRQGDLTRTGHTWRLSRRAQIR